MKKLILVLACYGLMVSSAAAGERWSAETCKHLQEMKVDAYGGQASADDTLWKLIPILRAERDHCGLNVSAEFAAAQAAAGKATAKREKHSTAPAPRQPMNCLSVPMIGGDVATGCN